MSEQGDRRQQDDVNMDQRSMNIHQRIDAVRKALGDGYMQKNTQVGFGNSAYTALTYDKLIRYARPHLLTFGVMIYPRLVESIRQDGVTSKGGFVLRYAATYDIEFVNMDDPSDTYTCRVEADANDSGDKASPKALTIALRIALKAVLNIETGVDEEQRGEDLHVEKKAPDGSVIVPMESMTDTAAAIEALLLDGDLSAAYEAWDECTQGEIMGMCAKPPTKGGLFGQKAWNMIKHADGEFRTYILEQRAAEKQAQ